MWLRAPARTFGSCARFQFSNSRKPVCRPVCGVRSAPAIGSRSTPDRIRPQSPELATGRLRRQSSSMGLARLVALLLAACMEPLEIAEPLMESGQSTPPVELAAAKPLLGARISLLATIAAVWRPGLLVMLADTDAGNVVTAAQAGSQWGYRLLPLVLMLIPMLYMVQELTMRLGLYTGRGHGELIRERFGI